MKGYHYTTWETWQRIKEEGLLPQSMIPERDINLPTDLKGVWLYLSEPAIKDHLSMLLYQVGNKGSTRMVKLEVTFNKKYLASSAPPDHCFVFGKYKHISSKEVGILKCNIPPKNIDLVGVYDLERMLATPEINY